MVEKNFMTRKEKREKEGEMLQLTLRMSAVMGLGPLEEKETTLGANSLFSSIVFSIVAVGSLANY